MKQKSIILTGLMFLLFTGLTFAQSGYIKIGDIKGEATDRAHKDWIIIESFGQGLEQQPAATGTSRRRASATLSDVVIVKKLDKSTPKLMELCAKGQVLPEIIVEIGAGDGRGAYKVTLGNARISSIHTRSNCDDGCEVLDNLAISYSKITWQHTDGRGEKVIATHDAKTGM